MFLLLHGQKRLTILNADWAKLRLKFIEELTEPCQLAWNSLSEGMWYVRQQHLSQTLPSSLPL